MRSNFYSIVKKFLSELDANIVFDKSIKDEAFVEFCPQLYGNLRVFGLKRYPLEVPSELERAGLTIYI